MEEQKTTAFSDYYRVLRTNVPYRLSFFSYCIDNIGNWLTFVACVSITDKVGGATYTSVYLILRLLPSFLCAGFVGPLADKMCKRNAMLICSIGSSLAVLLLALPLSDTFILSCIFLSTTIQFSFAALYEPARNSCIPLFVSGDDLRVATTLDGMGWSVIGAFGSSIGGFVNGKYGSKVSFGIDVVSYLVCAALVYLIPAECCREKPKDNTINVDITVCPYDDKLVEQEVSVDIAVCDGDDNQDSQSGNEADADATFAKCVSYLVGNRFIICLCLLKGSGAIVWGAADILTVKFSQMERYQTFGGESFTLGLMFAMVGVGCYSGPLLWNMWIKPAEKSLMFAIIVSLCQVSFSYIIMMLSNHVVLVLLATAIRSMGSAVIWIYSTLLIQLLVPTTLQGRVFAIERALYTVCEIVSIIFGGLAFDIFHLGVFTTCLVMGVVGCGITVIWGFMFVAKYGTNIGADALEKTVELPYMNLPTDDI